MITYDKGWWGNKVLFRAYGSAFPRAMPPAILSAAIAAVVAACFETADEELFRNAYPLQLFFFIVGFMVIFRNNLSYGRYWEGRTQLQVMTSQLSDAVRVAVSLDRTSVPKEHATPEQVEAHKWFCDTFVHLVSLFHGVALATLRGDFDMENLVAHDSEARAPPNNIRSMRRDGGKTMREGRPVAEQTTPRSLSATRKDAAKLQVLVAEAEEDSASCDVPAEKEKQHAWAGHKNLLDFFVLRTSPDHARHIHKHMKLPVIGGFTQAEGQALGAFTTSGDAYEARPALDDVMHGTMLPDGMYAPAPTERVQAVASWIHEVLIERMHAGGLRAPHPVQARIHTVLTGAFDAFEQCQKLTDTPFPFPWVQAVNISLAIFTLFAPFAIVAFIGNVYIATLLTFLAVATHATLNEVASDIEDPFHYDPNELPLPQMQYKLNERLLAVLYSERPIAFTDVGELTGPGNTINVPGVDNPSAHGGGQNAATPARKAPAGGDKFLAIAQAAFAAAMPDPDSPSAPPARPTFLMRSALSGRRIEDLSGLRAYKSGGGSNPGAMRWPAGMAAAGASVRGGRQSSPAQTRGSPRGSPHTPVGRRPLGNAQSPVAGSPLGSGSGNPAQLLGMPPVRAENAAPAIRSSLSQGSRAAQHAQYAQRRGWGTVRAAVNSGTLLQVGSGGAAIADIPAAMRPDPIRVSLDRDADTMAPRMHAQPQGRGWRVLRKVVNEPNWQQKLQHGRHAGSG